MPEFHIRRVSSPEDFLAIARFRYSIYVEEMNRKQNYVNHEQKLIVDSLDDEHASIFAAWSKGKVVGTVRNNFLGNSQLEDYISLYDLDELPAHIAELSSITTRLMVCPSFRKSLLAVRLASEAYRNGLENGIATNFIDCNAHLVSFFRGLGYVIHRDAVFHPEYGSVTVMRLDLHDFKHLEEVRSPLRRILRRWKQESRLSNDGSPRQVKIHCSNAQTSQMSTLPRAYS